MQLAKKATILFPSDLYDQLAHKAQQLGVSLEEPVPRASEAYQGYVSAQERLEAVRRLEAMSLPVGEPAQMKRESVPDQGPIRIEPPVVCEAINRSTGLRP